MWNRIDLKAKGKAAFKRNYWYCVLVALILSLVMGSAAGSTSKKDPAEESNPTNINVEVSAGAATVAVLLNIFVFSPLEIGGKKFFARNANGNAHLRDVAAGFTGNYDRNVLAMFLRSLFAALWSLLFVIPGIIKVYSYRMVPYILADHPELSATEAITLSRRMMNGSKWKAFVMDLSFIGWILLGAVTFGLALVFYVNPYIEASYAEMYLALRDQQ